MQSFVATLTALSEKLLVEKELFHRALFDSLECSATLESMTDVLKTLNSLADVSQQNVSTVLDLCHQCKNNQEELSELLITLRTLAVGDFKHWEIFYSTFSSIKANDCQTSDFLMTVRNLESHSFKDWVSFFAAVKVFNKEESSSDEFLLTIRHLDEQSFVEWETFFKNVNRLSLSTKENSAFTLRAFRHAVKYFSSSASIKGVTRLLSVHPDAAEAFSFGQLDSKKWLLKEARRVWGEDWGSVFVLAGWVGVLPRLMFDEGIKTKFVRSFDIDNQATMAAEVLNQSEVQQDWKFKSATLDICKMNYPTSFSVSRRDGSVCELTETPDVVINTSCEHIADLSSWWSQIPKGTRVIVQSNDGFHIPEHVDCFKSLSDFQAVMGLSSVDYKGEKVLPEFNRFMLIGRK